MECALVSKFRSKEQIRAGELLTIKGGVGCFAYAIPLPLAGLEPFHTDNERDKPLVPGLPPTLEPRALLVGLLTRHTYLTLSLDIERLT